MERLETSVERVLTKMSNLYEFDDLADGYTDPTAPGSHDDVTVTEQEKKFRKSKKPLSDKYKEMLQGGPPKPGWKNYLASGLVNFGGALSRELTNGRGGMDQKLQHELSERALGRRGWEEDLGRAKAGMDVEQDEIQQQERERANQAQEEYRQDALKTNDATRRAIEQNKLDQKNQYLDVLKQREYDELMQKYTKDNWEEKIEGMQYDPEAKEIQVNTPKGPKTLVQRPKWEREKWSEVPQHIREYYKSKGLTVPDGRVPPDQLREWGIRFDRDSDREIREKELQRRENKDKQENQQFHERLSSMDAKAEDRDQRRDQERQRLEATARERELNSRLASLREANVNSIQKLEEKLKLEGKDPYTDKDFLYLKDSIQRAWVDSKNALYKQYGKDHQDPYMDPVTGQPLTTKPNIQPQGPPAPPQGQPPVGQPPAPAAPPAPGDPMVEAEAAVRKQSKGPGVYTVKTSKGEVKVRLTQDGKVIPVGGN